MPELSDFAGKWLLRRTITDRAAASTGDYRATAILQPDAAGLCYAEAGHLKLGDGPVVFAERRYLWRPEGARIAVLFHDGRPFHAFDPGEARPSATHDCPPDTYDVRYDFGRWPDWQAEWQVRGPRKDYVSLSHYTRGGAA